jgi:hypothetical protein
MSLNRVQRTEHSWAVILALRRLWQEDSELKASLGYIGSPYLEKQKE